MGPRGQFTIPLPDGRALALGARTLVMGVVNVTPDSFSDGGQRLDPDVAVADALRMVAAGADLLDIGGESTRPGADPLPVEEEIRRVSPVLEGLRDVVDVPVSIDTYKVEVARRALDLGAVIVNDISGLTYEPPLAGLVATRGAALILMHHRGRSSTMYELAHYDDVVVDVRRELTDRVAAATRAGVPRDRLIVDPGIGFGKRAEHSLAVIARLAEFASLALPVLSGPSRKSFLTAALGDVPPAGRRWGTAAAVTASILGGAHIVRVHDVEEMVQVARTADAIRAAVASPLAASTGPRP